MAGRPSADARRARRRNLQRHSARRPADVCAGRGTGADAFVSRRRYGAGGTRGALFPESFAGQRCRLPLVVRAECAASHQSRCRARRPHRSHGSRWSHAPGRHRVSGSGHTRARLRRTPAAGVRRTGSRVSRNARPDRYRRVAAAPKARGTAHAPGPGRWPGDRPLEPRRAEHRIYRVRLARGTSVGCRTPNCPPRRGSVWRLPRATAVGRDCRSPPADSGRRPAKTQ